jgi:cysteinyl-tRNA synthetase
LIARGHAYEAGGEVLFDVQSMPDYGALSGRELDEQRPGARVAVDAHKKSPLDFVLWKQSSGNEPGWESPWGRGRPGWHIECSAMSSAYLGDVFDIHGGGLDLIFPHHENELAQSRCAHGTSVMANYWMHNGFLQVEGEKMSKSLGNFVTIRELLTAWQGIPWQGEIIRLAMLSTHYRQPIDFGVSALEQSMIALRQFKTFSTLDKTVEPSDEFINALYDDLNTPRAIAELHRLLKKVRDGSVEQADRMSRPLAMMDSSIPKARRQIAAGLLLLGINIEIYDPDLLQQKRRSGLSSEQQKKIADLISARTAARARKDFRESDRIRDELAAMGVVIKDSKEGTTWEIAR